MKNKFLVIASVLTISVSTIPNAHAQWVKLNGSDQGGNGYINALAAIDSTLFSGDAAYVFGGGSVWRSTNSDTTWTLVDSGLIANENNSVNALQVLGTNLFAATDSGVFRSTNNGTTWINVMDTAVSSFAVVGTLLFAGTEHSGIFLSTDNGTNWTAVNIGLRYDSTAEEYWNVDAFAVSGTYLFAEENGFFLSTNNGTSWSNVSDSFPGNSTPNNLAVIGTNILAGTNYGVVISTNNGTSWKAANSSYAKLSSVNVHAFAVVGTNIFAGGFLLDTGGVIFLSTDSGASWTSESLGLPYVEIRAFAVVGENLFAGAYGTSGFPFGEVPGGVFSRPLSQMIASSSVADPKATSPEIQSYPNPLSQSTTIRFTSAESGAARVTVVNLLGEEVARVFEGTLSAGEHSFEWDASGAAPGMYECVVEMNGSVQQVPVMVQP
jgi:hypothetical protein